MRVKNYKENAIQRLDFHNFHQIKTYMKSLKDFLQSREKPYPIDPLLFFYFLEEAYIYFFFFKRFENF